jgi:hypothetical protein
MKINQGVPQQGSFGLTPEMREQVEKYSTRKTTLEKPEASEQWDEEPVAGSRFPMAEEPDEEAFEELDAVQEQAAPERSMAPSNPLENLKGIGVELTDDDYSKIIFRGYLEKDIVVFPSIRGTKPLVATFRTLIGKEIDEADELMAEDISQDVKMTNQGYEVRRSMWHLSYAVVKLMGKPVSHDVMFAKSEKINTKGTAKAKRKVLAAMSPAVLAKMMHLHNVFTVSVNAILSDPEADYLKKP